MKNKWIVIAFATISVSFGAVAQGQAGADISACKRRESDKSWSLEKAIHNLKPDANAKAEAKNAEKQAREDLKQAAA